MEAAFAPGMTLEELRARMAAFVDERDWNQVGSHLRIVVAVVLSRRRALELTN